MNLMYTDKDIANLISLGIEGKHYVKKADNMIKLPDGVKQSGYQFNQSEIGSNLLDLCMGRHGPENLGADEKV